MAEIIEEWADKPFCYGADCCQFAGAIVEELSGHNPMADFDYADQAEAQRIIDSYGTLGAAVRATLGPPIPVDQAHDGDVLLVDILGSMPFLAEQIGPELVAVRWHNRCVVRTTSGVTDWPMERVKYAWRTKHA